MILKRLKVLFLGTVFFLSGCAGSDSSDLDLKKKICATREEVVSLFKPTPVKQPVCEYAGNGSATFKSGVTFGF